MAQVFDLNSHYLYFLSDAGEEFSYVARYDLSNSERASVEKGSWDITGIAFSRNGKYRVVTTNEDAHSKISITEVATSRAIDLPNLPDGDITDVAISDSEAKMAFYHNGSRSPADLYSYDFGTRKVARLTKSPEELANQPGRPRPRQGRPVQVVRRSRDSRHSL